MITSIGSVIDHVTSDSGVANAFLACCVRIGVLFGWYCFHS